MKNIFLIITSLFFSFIISAQKNINALNGYKYVYVPVLVYDDGRVDIWGISDKINKAFTDKGFTVITSLERAKEISKVDPCSIIDCTISHTNVTVGTNSVTLTIRNCKDEIIYSNTGRAMGLSMQDDFNKATRRAFGDIAELKYKFDPLLTPKFDNPNIEITAEKEATLKNYFDNNQIDILEGIYKSYQNDAFGYYKLGIKKRSNEFIAIVIESESKIWKPGEVKAIFEKSSMQGFYSVRWYMSNKKLYETFAEITNGGILSVEFKESSGAKSISKLVKMYPSAEQNKKEPRTPDASGSGFLISLNGMIATNAHVIADSKEIEVSFSNEKGTKSYKAKKILVDSKNDVAIIQISDEKFKDLETLPFGISENAEIGEKVFTIGYPLNDIMGSNFKVTDGIISAKSGISDDVRFYQISVPLQPGNSGGPLFNKDGNIIGITSARLNSNAVGTLVQNVNYAIKSNYLSNLVSMLPGIKSPSPTSILAKKELQEQVKVLKNFVCLIKVIN